MNTLRSVKLKFTENGITLADPRADLGMTPSRAIIRKITHVPEDATLADVVHRARYSAWLPSDSGEPLEVRYDEIGEGQIHPHPAREYPPSESRTKG